MHDSPSSGHVKVVSVGRLGSNIVRVQFAGDSLCARFSLGRADEAVGVYFSPNGDFWSTDVDLSIGRNYTIRQVDPISDRLTIDFMLHEGGVGATWARSAVPGMRLFFTNPRAWYSPPPDAEWQLLAADLAGIPALSRIVEELAPGARAHAVLEVLDPADIPVLETAGRVSVQALVGTGNGAAASELVAAVRRHALSDGPGYAWFAGEAAVCREMRKYFRRERGWSNDRLDVIGYWRADADAWNARYSAVSESVEALWQNVLDCGGTEREADEIYDEALERAGL
ncbi:siderophore-interacting protein [Skermania piniformis]|nr:siderophore-interacting protein [Skermania piniformis]